MAEHDWFQKRLADCSLRERALVEEVMDLKQEYLITSSQAFKDIKYSAAVEELIRAAEQRAGAASGMTISEVKSFCEQVQVIVHYYLSLATARASTLADWSVLSAHELIEFAPDPEMMWLDNPDYSWSLDYEAILARYIRERKAAPFIGRQPNAPELLRSFMRALCQGDSKLLENALSGEQVSLREIERDPRHRRLRELEISSRKETARELRGLPEGASDVEVHEDQRRMTIAYANMALREFTSRARARISWRVLAQLADFDALYDRAGGEMTLRTLEVERRLALAAVLPTWSEAAGLDGAQCVAQALRKIRGRVKRCEELLRLRFYPVEHLNRDLEKFRYQLWAIHPNQRWLAEFLDR